jgi:hypothetical protein
MVYDKKKSGDPDFDDKVPAGDHFTVVTAGDGKIIGRLDPALGPVTPEGSHLAVDVTAEDLDTRPAPGGKAEVKAEVQTFEAEDTPHETMSLDQVKNAKSENPNAAGAIEMQEKSVQANKDLAEQQQENEKVARGAKPARTPRQ